MTYKEENEKPDIRKSKLPRRGVRLKSGKERSTNRVPRNTEDDTVKFSLHDVHIAQLRSPRTE
jgi:hypothetical protein